MNTNTFSSFVCEPVPSEAEFRTGQEAIIRS